LGYRLNEEDGSWDVTYAAHVPVLGSVGHDYAGGIDVDPALTTLPVEMALRFEPLTPVYEYDDHPGWSRLFDGHVEQSGRFTGVVTVGGARYDIDALGSRDHSWGPRDWSHPQGWTFFTASFDREPGFISLWAADTHAGSAVGGYVWRAGRSALITSLSCDVPGGRPSLGAPFEVAVGDDSGASTTVVCRAHSKMRHQVGGGRSQAASYVDRWLVEIESEDLGKGHGEFELLAPLATEPGAPRHITSTPNEPQTSES
jgi:hypothetical protein